MLGRMNKKVVDIDSDDGDLREKALAAREIWLRMNNKNDVEDTFQDTRVDNNRIY